MSYEAQFRKALQAVGAVEVNSEGLLNWHFEPHWMSCAAGGCDVWVNVSGQVTLDDDKEEVYLRPAGSNLVESVRFAENLRRALAGEPSLEVERLQKALDQALFFAEIRPTEFDDDTLYARSTFDQNPMLFRDSFPELAAELKRRAGDVQE